MDMRHRYDPFFFISDPKNKNCKIFYTKFKFYMGVAIEERLDEYPL